MPRSRWGSAPELLKGLTWSSSPPVVYFSPFHIWAKLALEELVNSRTGIRIWTWGVYIQDNRLLRFIYFLIVFFYLSCNSYTKKLTLWEYNSMTSYICKILQLPPRLSSSRTSSSLKETPYPLAITTPPPPNTRSPWPPLISLLSLWIYASWVFHIKESYNISGPEVLSLILYCLQERLAT